MIFVPTELFKELLLLSSCLIFTVCQRKFPSFLPFLEINPTFISLLLYHCLIILFNQITIILFYCEALIKPRPAFSYPLQTLNHREPKHLKREIAWLKHKYERKGKERST